MKALTAILNTFTLLAVLALAQSQPRSGADPLTLTEAELREMAGVGAALNQAQREINQAADELMVMPLDDCAKVLAVVSRGRGALSRRQLAEERLNTLLERLRRVKSCDTCEWSQDFRSLVKPQQQAKP